MSSLPTELSLTPRFLNPSVGRPTPFSLSGLFLLSPAFFLGIAGLSLSGIFKAAGKESLFKRFDAVSKGKRRLTPEAMKKLLNEMFDAFTRPDDMRAIFGETIEAEFPPARQSKAEYVEARLEHQIGEYEAFFAGINCSAGRTSLLLHQRFLIDIEEASAQAHRHLMHGAYSEAYEVIARNEVLQRFLWPEVRLVMKKAVSQSSYVLLRALVALEVHLAHLALVDHSYETECLASDTNTLMSVWPTLDKPSKNPIALLFDWVKAQAGVRTSSAFYNHPKLNNIEMEMVTLKRWSSGSHQPDRNWLETLVEALFGDETAKAFWHRYYMALAVNYIGYVRQSLVTIIEERVSESEMAVIAPWPLLPHGYLNFATWGRERYSVWREYACDYEVMHDQSSQAAKNLAGFTS